MNPSPGGRARPVVEGGRYLGRRPLHHRVQGPLGALALPGPRKDSSYPGARRVVSSAGAWLGPRAGGSSRRPRWEHVTGAQGNESISPGPDLAPTGYAEGSDLHASGTSHRGPAPPVLPRTRREQPISPRGADTPIRPLIWSKEHDTPRIPRPVRDRDRRA